MVDAEDKEGYLPPDRQVRNIYDQTRQDIQKLETTKKNKRKELQRLNGEETKTFLSEDSSSFSETAQDATLPTGFTDVDTFDQSNQLPGADKQSADADLLML